MARHWMLKGFGLVSCAALFVAAAGFVVMSLWNWLMPSLFGLRALGFWQALGLLLLSKILFGGFCGAAGRGRWRRRMHERWEQMTPAERERFREGLKGRCGHSRPAGTESPA